MKDFQMFPLCSAPQAPELSPSIPALVPSHTLLPLAWDSAFSGAVKSGIGLYLLIWKET